jgi:hypothetical protein
MTNGKSGLLAALLGLATLALMAPLPAGAAPPAAASAAAPVFPIGSRIGLVPPAGMTRSKTFLGFVDLDANAGVVVNALPAAASADLKKSLSDEVLKKQGITVDKRETLPLAIGKGDLVIGTQAAPDKTAYRKWLLLVPRDDFAVTVTVQAPASDKTYSDAVVHAALATLTLRDSVPESEFLSLLPFTVGDLAGFRVGNIIPGRALLLVDAPEYPHLIAKGGLPEFEFDGRFIANAVPSSPNDPQERASLARDAFRTIEGLKEIQVTMAEPVRIDNQEGFETVASAKDVNSGTGLMVIQWLRFGGGATLQMIGISRAAIWDRELSRLRSIRDSIAFR